MYGLGWNVVVLVDSSVREEGRERLRRAGAVVVDAEGWIDEAVGSMRYAFWVYELASRLRTLSGVCVCVCLCSCVCVCVCVCKII